MRGIRNLGSLLLASAAIACGGPTEVGHTEVPAAFRSGALVVGEVVYGCRAWHLSKLPSSEEVLVDVFFPRGPGESPGLREEEAGVADQLGGELVHRFSTPAARLRLPLGRLEELDDAVPLDHVRNVPDVGRYDLKVSIVATEATVEDVKRAFLDVGGVIMKEYTNFPLLTGVIPDAGLRAVRSVPGVEAVQQNTVLCTT